MHKGETRWRGGISTSRLQIIINYAWLNLTIQPLRIARLGTPASVRTCLANLAILPVSVYLLAPMMWDSSGVRPVTCSVIWAQHSSPLSMYYQKCIQVYFLIVFVQDWQSTASGETACYAVAESCPCNAKISSTPGFAAQCSSSPPAPKEDWNSRWSMGMVEVGARRWPIYWGLAGVRRRRAFGLGHGHGVSP